MSTGLTQFLFADRDSLATRKGEADLAAPVAIFESDDRTMEGVLSSKPSLCPPLRKTKYVVDKIFEHTSPPTDDTVRRNGFAPEKDNIYPAYHIPHHTLRDICRRSQRLRTISGPRCLLVSSVAYPHTAQRFYTSKIAEIYYYKTWTRPTKDSNTVKLLTWIVRTPSQTEHVILTS